MMGMGAEENVADQIAGKLEDMLEVVRKVRKVTTAAATGRRRRTSWLLHLVRNAYTFCKQKAPERASQCCA